MILSIVTGTYNRINHLQNLVQSIRNSVRVGLEYEIIIVDGGSKDGTQDWCKAQPDIKLIEHGKLLGAVKAFNDGAYAAKGEYIILANDDVEFINESILSALSFMQDHSDVGVGCFYQDRGNQSWHVEQMPGVVDGVQASIYYGQVCIVPKKLGDKVGWWGNYLRTYGGDNELSCNVWELGYLIAPMPCACIHDTTPNDDLRKENNDKQMVKGRHPDTEAFVKKWTRDGYKGPKIGSRMGEFELEMQRYCRILYAPIYEPNNQLQRKTKHGLRDALAKIGLVVECDYVKESFDYMFDLATAFKPHLILTQIHSVDPNLNSSDIALLKRENPQARFVNWNGDYHPEHLFSQAYMMLLKQYDWCGFCTTDVAAAYEAEGIRWGYWQIGYEESHITKDYSECDVAFLANGYSTARQELVSQLAGAGIELHLYGIGWPAIYNSRGDTLYDFDRGASIYASAKMTIGDSQWPHAGGYVSNRLFQAMDAGVLLLQQRFDGMEEMLGLKDGEHLVVWDNVDDLIEKIRYYKEHMALRIKIASTGQKYVHENHSFDVRVSELLAVLYG